MSMQNEVKYPLGIQTFSEIVEGGYLYVDKTEYIYKMAHTGKYAFLCRPRRFGKSLLVSTMRSYFEGRRSLFKGLAIETLETEWKSHPVVHLDMSGAKHLRRGELEEYLVYILNENASRLGVSTSSARANIGLMQLLGNVTEKYNQKAVILLDEYDAPLLDVAYDPQIFEELRATMRNFYSPIKKCDSILRFVFITGITKFSQLSIFSELNNLKNVSMLTDYAAICGITKEELLAQMEEGIEALAEKLELTKDEAVEVLKENYDGYHFAWPSPDVYNPFSLLNAMSDREINSYWFGSGTPTALVEALGKFNVAPSEIGGGVLALAEDFDAPTENLIDATPLLYQSGYYTIKNYDKESKLYTLDIPNREVRIGLMRSLLPNYIGSKTRVCNATVARMQVALSKDDIDGMLRLLQEFLPTVPKADYVERSPELFEAHWQQMLYVIFSLLGANCDVEVRTARGRVDLVARTARKLYLMELKLNKSALSALRQMDLKEYGKRFVLSGLPIVKVGVNFDAEKRNIDGGWVIESDGSKGA